MLTCLMDTVPDGEINLTPAGGHHFMLEPTPIRLTYEAQLDPSHRHVGATHGCADSHQPHVRRKVEIYIYTYLIGGDMRYIYIYIRWSCASTPR